MVGGALVRGAFGGSLRISDAPGFIVGGLVVGAGVQ